MFDVELVDDVGFEKCFDKRPGFQGVQFIGPHIPESSLDRVVDEKIDIRIQPATVALVRGHIPTLLEEVPIVAAVYPGIVSQRLRQHFQLPELRAVPKLVCDEGLNPGPSEGSCIAPVWRTGRLQSSVYRLSEFVRAVSAMFFCSTYGGSGSWFCASWQFSTGCPPFDRVCTIPGVSWRSALSFFAFLEGPCFPFFLNSHPCESSTCCQGTVDRFSSDSALDVIHTHTIFFGDSGQGVSRLNGVR